jgi:hypothetical protein
MKQGSHIMLQRLVRFAVALDDLRFDLADLLVEKNLVREFAVDDLLTNLRDALGAE